MSTRTTTAPVRFDVDPTLPCRTTTDVEPEWFFDGDDEQTEAAKALCFECPRRAECLAGALRRKERFGIFGGYGPADRAALLRDAEARRGRPARPARYGEPGVARPTSLGPDRRRILFDAARTVVAGTASRRVAATAAGVNMATLAEVASVLRWAPDVAADVEAGLVALAPALRYAQAVRLWTERQEVAA